MSNVKWQDPRNHKSAPGSRRRGWLYYAPVADALRKRPGQWALVIEGTKSKSAITRIRRGEFHAFRPAEDFESASRTNAMSLTDHAPRYDIYIRYVGKES